MTSETIERGQDLLDTIEDFDLQIRKLKQAAAFIEEHGENYHYHLEVMTFGITRTINGWHFLPELLLDMLRPKLAKMEAERAALQAQFDAL